MLKTQLEDAKLGKLSPKQVSAIALALQSGISENPYTAIHILGITNAIQFESLVAKFLDGPSDPMLARIALKVLVSHWGFGSKYRQEIEQFAIGKSWDEDSDARLMAISCAGELARVTHDVELIKLCLSIFENEEELPGVRDQAYFSIARTAGKSWLEIPPASRRMNYEKDVDAGLIEWSRRQAQSAESAA